jgi:hypothetical protein
MNKLYPFRRATGMLRLAALSFAGLTAGLQAQAQSYCTPVNATACSVGAGDYINGVYAFCSPTSGSFTNLNTGCNGNPNNYADYTSNYFVSTLPGSSVYLYMENGPEAQGFMVWVDWNTDGDFADAGEAVFTSGIMSANDSFSCTINVPLTQPAGTTRIRVRSSWNQTGFDPCNSTFYGETEDYGLVITNAIPGCTGTPTGGMVMATANPVCAGSPSYLTLAGNTSGPGITYQWSASTDGGITWTPLAGATNDNYLAYITTTTDFRAEVTCTGGGTSMSDMSATLSLGLTTGCADSVWPGDANYDLIADNSDPLAIALAYNATGPVRAGANVQWFGQPCSDWTGSFTNGVNYKHADCNGDGLVDSTDVMAVYMNYGQTHLKGGAPRAKVTGLPDLYLDMTGITLTPGAMVSIPVKFGTAASPANNIYGIAATITIGGITPASAPTVNFNTGWLGGSPLQFSKALSGNTAIDWTYARTDHQNASGYGTLGSVSFTVPANATGTVTLNLEDVYIIDNGGAEMTDFNIVNASAAIHPVGVPSVGGLPGSVAVVPNPSSGTCAVQFSLASAERVEVRVTDITGRKVWAEAASYGSGTHNVQLPHSSLSQGIYMVQVKTASMQKAQTVKWMKQ